MLDRVGRLPPLAHDMLPPLAHDEVQVLICIARDERVMCDALAVLRVRAPGVAVERLEQRKRRAVQARAGVGRNGAGGEGVRFDAEGRRGAGGGRKEAEGEVGD